ncbi:uncharacterized protein M6B38_308525 [Iris pallida]|uniref:Uncharacterized protein n=1 Tax=Iris pallida TaxID=29817 RepID=A0AAX6HLX4_IRIPA|nr:uncharacterized protein M6B38_308525 [Iris pallida]
MAMELMEDDVLFADLSKQIALLIMDDDEEFPVQSPPVHAQGFHQLPQVILMPPSYTHDMMGYRRESKGTGVFIPRSSSLPRSRKNRSGKSTSNNNNNINSFQRRNDRSGVAASHVANSTSPLHSNCYTNSAALKNRA